MDCAYPSQGPLPERDTARVEFALGISGGRCVVMLRDALPRALSARGLDEGLPVPVANGKSRRRAS